MGSSNDIDIPLIMRAIGCVPNCDNPTLKDYEDLFFGVLPTTFQKEIIGAYHLLTKSKVIFVNFDTKEIEGLELINSISNSKEWDL